MKFDKKYIQPIIAAISLVAMFVFPFVNVSAGYYNGSLNGFTVAMNTYIGYLMLLFPLVLVLAPFVPKYGEKLPLLTVVTPVLCIVSWILCMVFAKNFVANLADAELAIGAYITLICYIALGVYAVFAYKKELSELLRGLKEKNKKD